MEVAVGVYWGLWNIMAANGGGAGGLQPLSRRGWTAIFV